MEEDKNNTTPLTDGKQPEAPSAQERQNAPVIVHHDKRYDKDAQGGDNPYVNFSARLYTDPWGREAALHARQEGGKPLYKTFAGRVGTRLVSRGLFGASFMTLGNLALRTWDPHAPVEDMRMVHKGLTYLSRGFDVIFGAPIKAAFGEEAVLFRSKKTFSNTTISKALDDTLDGKLIPVSRINGRSLGQEMVGVSFDFAAGSFGDALGRELISVVDPNFHNDWYKNGHVDVGELAKSAGKSLWRMLSYNQMEDWVAALPYAYQMRAQRHLISSVWPGSKFFIDNQNGGFHVNDAGKITGSYMLPGAIDLQFRFMGYNFYTLMFRDIYNHIGMRLHDWQEHGMHLKVPKHPIESASSLIDETTKYVAKSFIKSQLYMAPAVPFFWAFRTPQSRVNSMFVSDAKDGGPIVKGKTASVHREGGDAYFKAYTDDHGNLVRTTVSADVLTAGDMVNGIWENGQLIIDGKPVTPHLNGKPITPDFMKAQSGFDPYDKKYVVGGFEATLNPLGKAARSFARFVDDKILRPFSESELYARTFGQSEDIGKLIKAYPAVMSRHNIASTFANSAISYTPYMIAKYETANHLDMPLFDAATMRMLDGIDHGKWREVKEGVHDMASVVVRGPISQGTLAAVQKPRGLINSSYEAAHQDDEHQKVLHQHYIARKAEKQSHAPKRPAGWVAYETTRAQAAQGKENGAPDGVTIH